MKKQTVVSVLVVVLAITSILISEVTVFRNRTYRLVSQCPALAGYEMVVAIRVTVWPTQTDTSVAMGTDFQHILRDARVTKGVKTDQGPDVGMLIHVTDYLGNVNDYLENGSDHLEVTYSIEVGQDGSVTVARTDDLEGTRTYWKDKDGDLFDKLYQCYLENGGEEILN